MSETITLELPADLTPGESYRFEFRGHRAGPADKKGYLAKMGPYEGVVFDNYSNLRIRGRADGMESPCPPDSARTLDSNTVGAYVEVENPSSNGSTLPKDDLEVILFGQVKNQQDDGALRFRPAAVAADLIPGVRDA